MLKAHLVSIFGAASLIPNSAPFKIKKLHVHICDATTSYDEFKVEEFNLRFLVVFNCSKLLRLLHYSSIYMGPMHPPKFILKAK